MGDDIGSARNAVAVTPHDTNALTPIPRAVYVGTGGNIALRARGSGTDVLLKNVPTGTILPVEVQYIRATLTTAADLVSFN